MDTRWPQKIVALLIILRKNYIQWHVKANEVFWSRKSYEKIDFHEISISVDISFKKSKSQKIDTKKKQFAARKETFWQAPCKQPVRHTHTHPRKRYCCSMFLYLVQLHFWCAKNVFTRSHFLFCHCWHRRCCYCILRICFTRTNNYYESEYDC